MIYIGIDPSFRGLTAVALNDKRIMKHIFLDINDLASDKTKTEEIEILTDILCRKFLERYFTFNRDSHRIISIEYPYYNRSNPKTFANQIRLYQNIITACYMLNLESFDGIVESEPKAIKKAFSGNGNSDKDMMFEALKQNHTKYYDMKIFKQLEPKANAKKKDNELLKRKREGIVDAIAIALYGKFLTKANE